MPVGPSTVNAAAGKLAQVLSDVILAIHPQVAEGKESAKATWRKTFLELLEQHTAGQLAPLLGSVKATTTIPPELEAMLSEIGMPTEQFTGLVSQFFVFGVMFTVAQAMLAPFVQQVQNDVWSAHPDRPLPAPDVATAVVRGIDYGSTSGVSVPDWALTEAKKSGFDPEVFATMVGVTGMAPALQLLFEMIRRQIIDEAQLVEGIKQSDVKDEWIPFVTKLRYIQPTPIDMVRAAVQNQWDSPDVADPKALAKQWATTLGLEPGGYLEDNPDWFELLYNVYGRPPGPVEMAHAANRGLTDWDSRGSSSTSFAQAISESDIKDKYIPLLKELAVYYPPNGEIRTLLLHGGIDEATALALWKKNGVPEALAKGYLHLAQIEQVTQDKALAKADILTLVQEQALSDADATELLGQIGYSGVNAEHLLAMTHFRFELDALRSIVRRVASLYTGRKINATQAKEALTGIGLPPAQIDQLLATMTHQRDSEVLTPTPAQVAGGFFYKVLDYETAHSMLVGMGYDPWSAWLVLSDRVHGKLPNEPPKPTGGIFGN